MKLKILPTLSLLLPLACGGVEDVGTAKQNLTQVTDVVFLPSSAQADVQVSECQNSPGPYITLNGELSLGGFGVQLVFRNNAKGTHEHVEEYAAEVLVLSTGETVTLPKQPVLGGVGGNPWVLVQLVDSNDNPLTSEMLLGRCVQGLDNLDSLLDVPGLADSWLTDLECSNNPGPHISVDGLLTLHGVKAKLIFRNNLKGTHEADVVRELTLLEPGMSFKFPKQPPLSGVGGNPHIYLRYVDGDGNVLGEETYLGRCKQLSKNL